MGIFATLLAHIPQCYVDLAESQGVEPFCTCQEHRGCQTHPLPKRQTMDSPSPPDSPPPPRKRQRHSFPTELSHSERIVVPGPAPKVLIPSVAPLPTSLSPAPPAIVKVVPTSTTPLSTRRNKRVLGISPSPPPAPVERPIKRTVAVSPDQDEYIDSLSARQQLGRHCFLCPSITSGRSVSRSMPTIRIGEFAGARFCSKKHFVAEEREGVLIALNKFCAAPFILEDPSDGTKASLKLDCERLPHGEEMNTCSGPSAESNKECGNPLTNKPRLFIFCAKDDVYKGFCSTNHLFEYFIRSYKPVQPSNLRKGHRKRRSNPATTFPSQDDTDSSGTEDEASMGH